LRALLHALSEGKPVERFAAVEQIAQLLSEAQRNALGRLAYSPAGVPRQRLESTLRAVLTSESVELRARALDAVQIIGLDEEMLAVVRSSLAHEHWLVRLMAVRLLGERQGQAAQSEIAPLADDPDELVRRLARSYLTDWQSAATQPSSTQPSR
jgi:HEAT repeat protein